MKFYTKITVLLGLMVSICYAATPQKLTLREAILLSMRYNANVRTAELNRVLQKFQLAVAKWQFEPKYTFTAARTWNNNYSSKQGYSSNQAWQVGPSTSWESPIGTNVSMGLGAEWGHNNGKFEPGLTVNITQPLIAGFGRDYVEATLRNAFASEKINKLNLKQTVMQQVTSTITAYMTLVGAENSIDVDKQSLQRARTTLFQTRQLIKAGQNPQSDEVQAKSQVAQALAQLQSDKSALTIARYQLLQTIGLKPTTQISIAHEVPLQRYRVWSKEHSIKLSIANNVSYQTAVLGMAVLGRNLYVAKQNNRWSLTLSETYTRGGGDGSSVLPPAEGVGVPTASPLLGHSQFVNGFNNLLAGHNYGFSTSLNLSIPIDDMSNKENVLSARIALQNAEITLKQARQNLIIKTMSDRDNLLNLQTQIKLDQSQVDYDKQTLRNTIMRYKAGISSSYEVTQQSQTLASDQRNLVNEKITYFNALASFDENCGHTLQTWHISIKD